MGAEMTGEQIRDQTNTVKCQLQNLGGGYMGIQCTVLNFSVCLKIFIIKYEEKIKKKRKEKQQLETQDGIHKIEIFWKSVEEVSEKKRQLAGVKYYRQSQEIQKGNGFGNKPLVITVKIISIKLSSRVQIFEAQFGSESRERERQQILEVCRRQEDEMEAGHYQLAAGIYVYLQTEGKDQQKDRD